MEYITLNNGVKMPVLGFGLYQTPASRTESCTADAISVGYRAIDAAQCYSSEIGVGNAIAKSGISRSEFFVTTKIWSDGFQSIKQSIDNSLTRLQSD